MFLNLSLLSLLGVIIWWGIKLFSQQFEGSSLVGSLVFLGEIILFVWMWRVVSKNSWRWPSMKLTVFSLALLFVVFAFAGVSPFSDHKDAIINQLSGMLSSLEENSASSSNDASSSIELPILRSGAGGRASLDRSSHQDWSYHS